MNVLSPTVDPWAESKIHSVHKYCLLGSWHTVSSEIIAFLLHVLQRCDLCKIAIIKISIMEFLT